MTTGTILFLLPLRASPCSQKLRQLPLFTWHRGVQNRHFAAGKGVRARRKRFARKGSKSAGRREDKTTSQKSGEANNKVDSPTESWSGWLIPVRYRSNGSAYTRKHWITLAQRLPLWLALVVFFSSEYTAPYKIVRIHGASMIPTIAPDGSDVWLESSWLWRKRLGFQPKCKVGDIVGFAHPDHPRRISCKRVVGVAGDRVRRYGQYFHLFVHQDPENLGIVWPTDAARSWIDRTCPWDKDCCLQNLNEECQRTIVVPEGHVWLEGDCPNLAVDSRHFGPVPVEWLNGKISAHLWPLRGRRKGQKAFRKNRPHPVPLDTESLRRYNLHMAPADE